MYGPHCESIFLLRLPFWLTSVPKARQPPPMSTPSTRTLPKTLRASVYGLCAWVLSMALWLGADAAWAAPAAGALVTNQASGTFIDSSGLSRTNVSNVVQISVGQVASFTLAASAVKSGAAGSTVNFSHTLVNTGNGPDSFSLTLTDLPAGFGFSALQIFADTNADGLPDNNVPLTSTGVVPVGGSFGFVVAARIPATAASGTTDQIRVDATSGFDPTRTTAGSSPSVAPLTDTVNVVGGPALSLQKTVANATPLPGDALAYRLLLRNAGARAASSGPSVLIDGAPAAPVLVRDAIPPNTRFAALATPVPAGTIALYHRVGDSEHTYTTTIPVDLKDVDAVGLAIANVPVAAMVELNFSVILNANAAQNGSGTVANTARVYFNNEVAAGVTIVPSNDAIVTLLPSAGLIRNYTSPSHTTPADYSRLGSTLYLVADATACNTSSSMIETRVVIITGPNGERETFTATETGPNTGVFTLPAIPTRNAMVVANSGIIEARSGDRIAVDIQGCGRSIVTEIVLVDPVGVVFDSRSNVPIAGATVSLRKGDGAGGCTITPATVQEITPAGALQTAPSTVLTGADGKYVFELTPPGDYCLMVTPPGGYAFPSAVPVGQLPAGRTISVTGPVSGGSYGGSFIVGVNTGPVTVDVPLDPLAATNLFVRKTASRTTAEIADFVDYTVKIKNNATSSLGNPGVVVADNLPAGFAFQPGSVRLNGQLWPDPAGGRGPRLDFNVGNLGVAAESVLTYRVRIGPGALEGDGINRAQASFGGLSSNLATATVKIQGGVFSSRGYIIGKVFLDCNRNQIQDAPELGIPGVRVYLEDGTSAVSDAEGKYSFYGVTPRTHVLKLDMTTMPAGSTLTSLTNRNAGDPGSTFVDLKNGELFKANFAEGSCQAAVLDEVKVRREKADQRTAETERTLAQRMEADPQPRAQGDVKAQPASGVIGAAAVPVQGFTPIAPRQAVPINLGPRIGAVANVPSVDLEKMLPEMNNAFGFVDLKDGDTLPIAQTNVRIKGAAATDFRLSVNGVDVSGSRVGKKSVLADRQLQAWEFVGVSLKPGSNTLTARQFDSFDNERGTATITLIAPDKLGRLEVLLPSAAIADGVSASTIVVKLTDDQGVLVTVRTPITLEASGGRWQTEDLDPQEPGLQVFIEGGRGEFLLSAPGTPSTVTVRATSGILKAESRLDFLPDLRPMIAAGVIEGVLNLRKLDSRALVPARKQDNFEQELTHFSRTSRDGKAQAAARAAVFLKGKVKGEYLLTMAYDSDKETRERLFRDIQPDEFYPVYGDSSTRNFDAQSTSKLYVRVDKDKSWLLYGDFTTQSPTSARKLGVYSRSLTGVKEHFENENVVVNAFASRDSTRQVVDEIPANGTSGPYRLTTANALENSEKVEILVRDRSQPGLVLKAIPQSRFVDYEIEQFTGQLIFKGPVPSLDPVFNPQSIRITYEVDQGGKEFWVAGIDAQVKINDFLEVGAIAVDDKNPQDPSRLRGVNATVKLSEKTFLTGELARAEKGSLGSGDGKRVELRHEDKDLQALAYAARTDATFESPGSYLSRGRAEAGGKLAYRIDDLTIARAEVLRTEDVATGGKREGAYASIERSLNENLRVEIGVRHGKETGVPANPLSTGTLPNEFTSVKAKVSGQVSGLPQAGVFAEYEQDVNSSDRKIAAIGGDYQIANRGRLYMRHELISSLSGPYALNTSQTQNATVLGIDGDYMKDGHVFSEYRVRDAYSGANTEAAIGLRNLWSVTDSVRLATGFERVRALDGVASNEATALTFGIEYTAADLWKGTARLEVREATSSSSLFSTVGLAGRISRDWTVLGRNSLAITRNKGTLTGERMQDRLQAGVAYRDTETDVWSGLARVEHRQEKDDTQQALQLKRTVELFTINANYQPSKQAVLSARLASKWVTDDSYGLASRYSAHLVGARFTFDITDHWDVGLVANTLFSGDRKARQYGLGLEVGYLVSTNLWLSAGYNFFGFKDDDLAGADYTNRGAYVRLRYKFDEAFMGAKSAAAESRVPTQKIVAGP